jgi:alanine dehydrogenase
VQALADKGLAALDTNPHLKNGLQIHNGEIVYPGLAEDFQQAVRS